MWTIEEAASHRRRWRPEKDETITITNQTFLPTSEEKQEARAINQRLFPPKRLKMSSAKEPSGEVCSNLVACRVFILSIIYINMYKLSKKKVLSVFLNGSSDAVRRVWTLGGLLTTRGTFHVSPSPEHAGHSRAEPRAKGPGRNPAPRSRGPSHPRTRFAFSV